MSDSPLVDRNQVNKATLALIKWAKKNADKNQNIVGNHQSLWVVVTTKKFPDSVKVKPVPIPISHSLYKDADICLFTKDPQRTYKDMVAEANLPQIKKVIGISKLKSKFKPYEAKRQLNDSYDLFLVDEPVVEFLPKALGKSFFNKKKLPVTVDLKRKGIKKEYERILTSTLIRFNKGTCTSIKAGTTDFTADDLTDNVLDVIEGVSNKFPGGWDNIQSIHLKTGESIALPIYAALPDEPIGSPAETVSDADP